MEVKKDSYTELCSYLITEVSIEEEDALKLKGN